MGPDYGQFANRKRPPFAIFAPRPQYKFIARNSARINDAPGDIDMTTQNPPTPILIITGPTAVGKTAVAAEVCRAIGGEMISADSMQVYRGLDIGTAKPAPDELAGVPCHLIDVLDPQEEFSVARFIEMADAAISDIRGRGREPVIAGGTGLYLKGLLYGLFDEPSKDDAVRIGLRQRMAAESPPALHRELAAHDPDAAARISPTDRHRIERALEVFHVTGRPISDWQKQWAEPNARFPHRLIILTRPREALYRRIEARVDEMLDAGWEEEVRRLIASNNSANLPHCFKSIGYREMAAWLRGEMTFDAMAMEIKTQTRRLSKRQLTWFRKMPAAEWIDIDGLNARQAADKILKSIV